MMMPYSTKIIINSIFVTSLLDHTMVPPWVLMLWCSELSVIDFASFVNVSHNNNMLALYHVMYNVKNRVTTVGAVTDKIDRELIMITSDTTVQH